MNENKRLKPIKVSVRDILVYLFAAMEIVCLRVFADKKGDPFRGQKFECQCVKYSDIEPELIRHNQQGRGVFFVVNYGGPNDESITRINAQFVEMDKGTFEEQLKKIDEFPIKPSMIIKTQKSLHVYYFMDGTAQVSRFRKIQKQLVKQFDGDPACVNESRCMRLPGFYHNKMDTPVMVECIDFHPKRRYSQADLAAVLPEVDDELPPPKKSGTGKGLDVLMNTCDFMKYCQDHAAVISEPLWYAMISNLAVFEGGTDRIHELSKPYPGYTVAETQKKINHFLDSETGPITCQKIFDDGFQCPKLASGKCPKSPAGLSYRPLNDDVLRCLLEDITKTGDTVKDTKAAENFVKQYLYNFDEVSATAFIESDIQKHFDLKPTLLKPLKASYKNTSKTYQSSQNAKRAKGGEIPRWYELTEKGSLRFLPGILAKILAEQEPAFYSAERYYRYINGVYREMPDLAAQRIVQEQMLPREAKFSQITDAEKQWRMQVQKDICELNPNPYIINVRNGLYNVQDGRLAEHTPDYISTVQLPVNYNENTDCPRFKKYLNEVMDGDMAQVALIQELFGYILVRLTLAQKAFVLVGEPNAGKSLLLNVINEILLGQENVSNISWQSLNERFKLVKLYGKLANTFGDLPDKPIEDNGLFKALVGEDYITAEEKNKPAFSFKSTARMLFSCNSLPRNYGDRSEGFYRRLIIIRFNHAVPEDKRDPDLLDKFRKEADGIFQFALEGLRRLMENNFRFSETQTNLDELQKYREESDSVLSFAKECCELDAAQATGSTELYNAYKVYCADGGLKPFSHKTFVQRLTVAFPDVTNGKDKLGKRRVLNGIKLGEILA